ncbi:MAG: AraC family transcriptional regulator [Spirochaetales bacterium]|nr:AraC family transcriptional regulator [Spirochaetales bacterium]
MKNYYVTKTKEAEPSVLSVRHEGRDYHFSLLHASVTKAAAEKAGEYGSPHSHAVYHLILYLSGANRIILGGRTKDVRRGTLFLVSPGTAHDFYPVDQGELEYAEITFEYCAGKECLTLPIEKLLRLISREKNISLPDEFLLNREETEQAMKLFYEFGELQKDYRLSSFTIHLKMLEILNRLCQKASVENRNTEELALRTAAIIRNHLTEKLNLDLLSEELGFSKTYLNREFRKTWNRSPMEYHKSLRLEKAADLLRSSEKSLREIAAFFHFYDEYHFSRSFQSLYGIPPGEYRKRQRQT